VRCGSVEDLVSFSMGCGKSAMKTSLPAAAVGSRSVTPVGILRSRPVSPQVPPVSGLPDVEWVVEDRKPTPYVTFEEGGEPEMLQLGLRGTVVSVFLQANLRFSHTFCVAFSEGHLDRAKEVIRKALEYKEDGFRWPVESGEVTFSSKEHLSLPFENIFDRRSSDNVEEQEMLPVDEISERDIVKVAYTPVFRAKKATKTDPGEYKGGVTFLLQSIVLMEKSRRQVDVGSPAKRRKVWYS
jgi:hypothetical protein